MTPYAILNDYINRYGEREGVCNFLTLCQFNIQTLHDKNEVKKWEEIKKKIEDERT